MAQFDVHRNPRGGAYPLLLDVQSGAVERLATRIVVPLVIAKRKDRKPITGINPIATILDVEYILVFQELAAVPRSALGEVVASLGSRRSEIVVALDLMFTGS